MKLPPRLATWMLQRWGSGPRRECLAGDLIEQYQQGRASTWYWRQVVWAIIVGVVHDALAHKVLAFRALVVGWIALDLGSRGRWHLWLVVAQVPIWGPVHLPTWLFAVVYFDLALLAIAALSGWIVGRLHRPYAISMVTMFATSFALYFLISTIDHMALLVGSMPPHWIVSHTASELFAGVCLIPMLMVVGGLLGAGTIESCDA